MNARSGADHPVAVGVCLGRWGAVVAVVAGGQPRVTAVAEVSWPGDPTAAVARRALARSRRSLGLDRWVPAAVVVDASLPGGPLASARLLAGAALAQVGVVPDDHAESCLGACRPAIADAVAKLATGSAGARAVGAACSLEPAWVSATPTGNQTLPAAVPVPGAVPLPGGRTAGAAGGGRLGDWVVERIGEPGTGSDPRGVDEIEEGSVR